MKVASKLALLTASLADHVQEGDRAISSSKGRHGYHPKHYVQTTSGLLEGHLAPNRSTVTEYLGIRYAKPATGPLRFARPERYNFHDQYYNASAYSPDCPAVIAPAFSYPELTVQGSAIVNEFVDRNNNHTQSEDCMTLNIWTRSSGNQKQSRAVLVFFHGGRFQIPGSNSAFYNGQYLAASEDVVVITFNKREAFFGYPGVTPNLGLLDFRMVIEWCRDNIAAFGGDPARITIWGQSAGGVAVDWYSYAYKDDPIVRGLIADSGVAFNGTAPTWPGEQERYFLNVSVAAGCPNDTTIGLACLRQKPFDIVLEATKKVPGTHRWQQVSLSPFRPTVDNETVFADYIEPSRKGHFARLPMLVGNMNHESGWYRVSQYAANINMTELGWRKWESWQFYCAILFQAYWRRQYDVSTWVYRYFGDWPNLRLYPTSGAYHGTILDMIFGTAQDVAGGRPNTAEEDQTIRYIMKVWATFARDPQGGLVELGLPRYNVNASTLIRLGYENTAGSSFVDSADYAEFCPPLDDPMPNYGAPPWR